MFALKQRPATPDRDLIAAVIRGDEAAFGQLVERYKERVFRLLGPYCRDSVECEDLAQEVFLKVFRKLHTFKGTSLFSTWMFRIVTNCAILGRVESFASKQQVLPSMVDGLAMGLGFTWVLVVLGAMREFFGAGTLFADASLLLGQWASVIEMTAFPGYGGTLLLILPPGAFICLGLMLAGKRVIDRVMEARGAKSDNSAESSLEGAV